MVKLFKQGKEIFFVLFLLNLFYLFLLLIYFYLIHNFFRPPYDTSPTGKKITHCFVNIRQVNQPIDWAMLASKGILCFMPQYLSDYLTSQIPLNPRECVIPEFKKYLTLLPK